MIDKEADGAASVLLKLQLQVEELESVVALLGEL